MSKYCVYRYMIGDEWIYVGKAAGTLHARIRAHANEERFHPFLSTCTISYIDFNHRSDMDHAEAALIKIKKPKLNISCKNDDIFPFLFDDSSIKWNRYYTKEEITAKQKEEKRRIREYQNNIKQAAKDIGLYRHAVKQYNDWYKSYQDYVIQKAQYNWSRQIIDILSNNHKKRQYISSIILDKADDGFVDSCGILQKMSNNWKVREHNDDSIIITFNRDNLIDIVADVSPYITINKALLFTSRYCIESDLRKLGAASVEDALVARKQYMDRLENVEKILEDARSTHKNNMTTTGQ